MNTDCICRCTDIKPVVGFALLTDGVTNMFTGKLGIKILQKYDDIPIEVNNLDHVNVTVPIANYYFLLRSVIIYHISYTNTLNI